MSSRSLRSQSNPKTNERSHAAGPGAIVTPVTDNPPLEATGTSDESLSLTDINRNIESSFSKVFDKLDHLTTDIAAIKTKVSEIEGSVCFNSEKVKEIEKDIIPKVKANLESQIADLQKQLTTMEIYNRRANLLFYGLAEDRNENVCKVIRECIVSLGINEVEAANMAFVNAHRLPRRATQNTSSNQPQVPNPIIVKFVYMADRNKVLAAFENVRRPRDNDPLLSGTPAPARVSVRTDLPPALKARRGYLAKVAYQMRKKDGVSTKIFLQQTKVCLQWKQKGATSWNDYQDE